MRKSTQLKYTKSPIPKRSTSMTQVDNQNQSEVDALAASDLGKSLQSFRTCSSPISPPRSSQVKRNSSILSRQQVSQMHERSVIKLLGLNLGAVCSKPNHDKNKILFICSLPECQAENRLGCAYCQLESHSDHPNYQIEIQQFCKTFDERYREFENLKTKVQELPDMKIMVNLFFERLLQQFTEKLRTIQQNVLQSIQGYMHLERRHTNIEQKVEQFAKKNIFEMNQQELTDMLEFNRGEHETRFREVIQFHNKEVEGKSQEGNIILDQYFNQLERDIFAALEDNDNILLMDPNSREYVTKRLNKQKAKQKREEQVKKQFEIIIEAYEEEDRKIIEQQEYEKKRMIEEKKQKQKEEIERQKEQQKQQKLKQQSVERDKLLRTFPHRIYTKDCQHRNACNTIPIFPCCNQAYPCSVCHGYQSHPPRIAFPSYRYCMNCLDIYLVPYPTNQSVNCMSVDPRQEFLQTEVVDKGLDVEACQHFLIQNYPDKGDDLEQWTLDELQSAIDAFKKKAEQEQVTEEQIQQPQSAQTRKVEPNELSDGTQSIKITGYKKEDAGFFKSSYITFQIVTQPIGWNVSRRYSDFEWLRAALQKFFPSFIIPPIHKKRSKRSFEDLYLSKRQIFLERFFDSILKSYELRSNKILKMFLTCQSQEDFKAFQESVNKLPAPQTVSKMVTKEGEQQTQATIETYQYAQLTGEYFNQLDQVYKKIRVLSKGLQEIQLQNSLKIYNIGEVFAQLFQQMNKLNQMLPIGQTQGLAATFLNLHNTMITWGNIIAKSIDQTEEYFNSYFKYTQHYTLQIKQLYTQRSNIYNDLEKFKQRLQQKKEKLFELGDITKWELNKEYLGNIDELLKNKKLAFANMCEQETKIELNMMQMLGFYTNQIYSQTQEYFQLQQKDLSNHFKKFCQTQTYNITDHHQLWADAISNLQNNLSIKQKQTQQIIVEQ